jgi:hypothetical protein
MGVTMKTNEQQTSACTIPGSARACAPVTVKVPTGRTYHVTVFSSFAAVSTSTGSVKYCPVLSSVSGVFCLNGGDDAISLAQNYHESAASSAEKGPLQAGTYTFATMLDPSVALTSSQQKKVQTTVLVRDALAGPPID